MAFELGGFGVKEIGVILLLVVVGMFLVQRVPPVRKIVTGA